MRFPSKKMIGAALTLGVVAALVVALPAYAAAAPTSFTPSCGQVGTAVTLTGTGFLGSTAVVFPTAITQSAITVVSDNTITTTVPATASGASTLTVNNPGGNGTTVGTFTVAVAALPTISNFTPTTGPVGTIVIITGTNFCGTSQVKFGATVATTFTVNSSTQITATVPALATTGVVSVTQPGGTATTVTNFTVTGTAPSITSFTPTSGHAGTSVIITGTNFTGATSVKFNGTAAVYTVNSATQITTTVPVGATTGVITVVAPGGTATSTTIFTIAKTSHIRSVTFSYAGNRASGAVTSGFNACKAFVPVYIQQQHGGGWQLLDTTATNASGHYSTWVPDRHGKFRATVKKQTLVNGVVCKGDTSPIRTHA